MNSKNGSIKKLIILVLILAIPGFLYYLLTAKGKNRYKPLQVYGPKKLAGTFHKVKGKTIPDTIYHTVGDFSLTDQDGQTVTLNSLNNSVVVVNFFYTGCPTLCKTVNQNIALLAKGYLRNKMVRFISVTVDPQDDNDNVLKNYARQFGVNSNKWKFLTGDTTTIYRLARNGFLVNALKINEHEFIYGDKVMLMDGDHRIRGYYSGNSVTEMTTLNDEIKVQISEELRKIKTPEM